MTRPNFGKYKAKPINGFPSITEAARAAGMTRQDFRRSLVERAKSRAAKRRLDRELRHWDQMELIE